jgi:hypothetical protein
MSSIAERKEVAIIVLSRKTNPRALSEKEKAEFSEKVKSLFDGWTVEAVQIGEA